MKDYVCKNVTKLKEFMLNCTLLLKAYSSRELNSRKRGFSVESTYFGIKA